ncbi:hypothetical protein INS49_014045 [Diaporthe citri]|uniref:uncharacterized protein n=1 Tax=Diaporthe citri TaxID=83186 RepID=UPI001C7F30DB|nr:uncharacterized protein INS49_014045 [Diaporthe citri]KAG6358161.1 hypothetical protein INS49_014045 [Diaporthe citri]
MATEQSTHAGSPACLGIMEDINSSVKATPGENLEGVAQSSSASVASNNSCEMTPCPSESQSEQTPDESCGTTAPSSPAGETEEALGEDFRARLSKVSLQDNELDPRPSQSTGLPKVDKPQAGTNRLPFGIMIEMLSPPHIVTIGRAIRTTAVELLLEQDYFRSLSREHLWMSVGLRDLNTGAVVDESLKGHKFFPGNPPVAGLSENGIRVLKFVFNAHSMRVKQYGSYRLFYSVNFRDPRGCNGSMTLQSSGFVIKDCPDFTCEQMEFIDEQERQGHLRLRQDGGIDVLVARSG